MGTDAPTLPSELESELPQVDFSAEHHRLKDRPKLRGEEKGHGRVRVTRGDIG